METTTYIALSRQMMLQRRMDIIANNIANITTSGFQAEELLTEPVPFDAGDRRPISFVQDVALVRDLTPGTLTPTGNDLDLAIEGSGYFVADTPQGPRYTRGGQFALNPQGELTTAAGHLVLDQGGAPIAVPPGSGEVTIAPDGTVSTRDAVAGRLGIVSFADLQDMQKAGDNLYMTEQAPEPAPAAQIVQGMLESSNVRPVIEMTGMMTTVRAYQGTQKLIDTHHELLRRAVERMLEVNG
jgi:flagellar basal-body rod protein FlgF